MDVVKKINDVLSIQRKHENRTYLGASQIGRICNREIWYEFTGAESEPLDTQLLLTFEVGRRLETMILDLMEQAHIDLERPSKENHGLFLQSHIKQLQGHMDGVINGDTVLEIKTAKHSSFQKFASFGLKEWSMPYYSQLQTYMGMSGLKQGLMVAFDKDLSTMHSEMVYFDEPHYEYLCLKAESIIDAIDPPERINKSPIYYVCARCKFKKICHGSE
jgi:CRISPR/Cas system-associated exonuclease Cas4 (RecB family)